MSIANTQTKSESILAIFEGFTELCLIPQLMFHKTLNFQFRVLKLHVFLLIHNLLVDWETFLRRYFFVFLILFFWQLLVETFLKLKFSRII